MGIVFWLFQHLPRAVLLAFMRFVAWTVWTLGIRRQVALSNLEIAFPEKSPQERWELARRCYRHLAVAMVDFLRTPGMSDEELRQIVNAEGFDKLTPLLEARKGFIVLGAHFGNFEMIGVYGSRHGVPLTALTRKLKGAANALWVSVRRMAGIDEIHKGMDNLVAAVNSGKALAIFIDQNMLLKRAVFVPFFGKLAATTPAPAVVAERTGVPLFITQIVLEPDGRYRTLIEGPYHFERKSEDRDADILAFTAMLNDRLERMIRQYPEQWFWLHRRWKTRPPNETAAAQSRPAA